MPGGLVNVLPTTAALRQRDVLFVAVGSVVLVTGMLSVRDGEVPAWERDLFEWVNELPGPLLPVLWPFQQLGAFAIVPLLALVLAITRRVRWSVAVMVAGVLKLISERVVKAVVTRGRPFTSIGPDIEVRGDVPTRGESFVSGHAILSVAVVALLTPLLPRPWQIAAWICAALALIGRVYVGAHNPLDVVCGAALGLAIAGAVGAVIVRRTPPERPLDAR
jgi:glycosyltransferase 2 family protein